MAEDPTIPKSRNVSSELASAVAEIELGNTSSALVALRKALETMTASHTAKSVRPDEATRDAELLRIQQRLSEAHVHEAALFSSIALMNFPEVSVLKQLDAQILERIRLGTQLEGILGESHEPEPASVQAARDPAPAAEKPIQSNLETKPGKNQPQPTAETAETDESTEKALSEILTLNSVGTLSALSEARKIATDSLKQSPDNPLQLKASTRLERRVKEREAELQTLVAQVEELLKKGQFDEAKRALERALALDPGNEELQRFKVELSQARRKKAWAQKAGEKPAVQSAKAELGESPRVGEVLAGRYEILEPLGTGGMSVVYKARDVLAGHIIALKVVRPLFSRDEILREKFKKELHVARRLTHPNVIRIHDIGEYQAWLFISMELVAGQTVGKILAQKKRLNSDEFLNLFNQFAPALGYIHSQKVLHRDIKPQNLMVNAEGVLKIMDFGIARDLTSDKTTAAIPMGTPAYMSPELLEGSALSPASDIYSAGIMFYQLLTGKAPFTSASPYDRLSQPVPRVSDILLGFPKDLDDAVYRCMQVQPDRRFQSVEEMVAGFSKQPAAPATAPGRLAGLLLEEPANMEDGILAFSRVIERVLAIHASGEGRPVLSPQAIRWSGNVAEVDVLSPVMGRHQTRAVNCKYASAEEFQEATHDREGAVASDTYVLGFMFYEIFLGERKFREQFSEFSGRDADLKWLNWHSDPSVSAAPLKEVLETIPAELSDIIESMIHKAADRRPSLAAVKTALTTLRISRAKQSGKTLILNPVPLAAEGGRLAVGNAFPKFVVIPIALVLLAVLWFIWKTMM